MGTMCCYLISLFGDVDCHTISLSTAYREHGFRERSAHLESAALIASIFPDCHAQDVLSGAMANALGGGACRYRLYSVNPFPTLAELYPIIDTRIGCLGGILGSDALSSSWSLLFIISSVVTTPRSSAFLLIGSHPNIPMPVLALSRRKMWRPSFPAPIEDDKNGSYRCSPDVDPSFHQIRIGLAV